MKLIRLSLVLVFVPALFFLQAAENQPSESTKNSAATKNIPASAIRAFCIDFNWGPGGPNGFAKPGLWADADPAKHIAWYKTLGANVIQTFCVSCNGYAWYKNGFVPQQPGLKSDFLREMVQKGHQEHMMVLGYFCAGSNTKWGQDHPDLSYGFPSEPHIPYTDEYLAYLDSAIRNAVATTGIDGFMLDWLRMPTTRASNGDRWLECEKKLYAQLMDEPFPGEQQLLAEKMTEYGRRAVERCWKTIYRAAKDTKPDCIVWLTCCDINDPHIVNSRALRETDWLLNEAGDLERTAAAKKMIGPQTRLITCLANWNGQDPIDIIPAAIRDGVGLYGFSKPGDDSLLPLEPLLALQVYDLDGDDRNIAALARTYHGVSMNSIRGSNGSFTKPKNEGRTAIPPYVLLAFDDSGDFGPHTPGTKTSGWQEALNFCVKSGKDLYVKGGFGGRKAIYHIKETIRFPAAQDFRVDGGVYVLNWQGPADQDLLFLDSAMNCEYHLGILVYGGRSAALRIKPEKPVPVDGFPAWVESQIFSQGIADPNPFKPGERKAGTGLVFDGSKVSISYSSFYFASVLNFNRCVELMGDVSFNDLSIPHLHSNADRGTLMVVGEQVTANRMLMTLGVDQGAKDITGIILGGRKNTLELGKRNSNKPIPNGKCLILTETADGNQINWTDSDPVSPTNFITDQALSASNQLTFTGPPPPIRQIPNVGKEFSHVQRLFPATIRWSGGDVVSVTLIRQARSVDFGQGTNRELLLSVGDELRISSLNPPTVSEIPVKTRSGRAHV